VAWQSGLATFSCVTEGIGSRGTLSYVQSSCVVLRQLRLVKLRLVESWLELAAMVWLGLAVVAWSS
jgi:hypothetical protein